jgi:hypothetical protein
VDWTANTNLLVGAFWPSSRAGVKFSADSRYLVYACTNAQVAADTNRTFDVYLYDLLLRTNLLVSQRYDAPFSGNEASDAPDISPDGRFIAYRSDAGDLVPGDTNGVSDVFLYDRLTGETKALSVSALGGTANGWSFAPQISRDGRSVLFKSWASDMTGSDFNQRSDLFMYSMLYAGIAPGGLPAQGPNLNWPIETGTTYHVQFLDDLNSTNWQNAGGSITILGDWAYFTDPTPVSTQRYYRIVAD